MNPITLTQIHSYADMQEMLRKIIFRGIYNNKGFQVHPYKNAHFTLTTVYPQASPGGSPEIQIGKKREPLFTPQPTIYENQTKIIEEVDQFLLSHDIKMSALRQAVKYDWKGRGEFHVLPPV